jgi:NitT/TauT family transport system substrate-binding protein
MRRLIRYFAVLALLLSFGVVQAQLEKRDVHIAVGGKTALYYLPLTVTERLGYFKDEGLNVRISDFPGGTRSLEAVVGGSADVVAGAYEHTINMQSRKQNFQAFVLTGAAPQITVAISSRLAATYHSPKDLKDSRWASALRARARTWSSTTCSRRAA